MDKGKLMSSYLYRKKLLSDNRMKNLDILEEIHEGNLGRIRQNVKEAALCAVGVVTGRTMDELYDESEDGLVYENIKEALNVRGFFFIFQRKSRMKS